MQYSMPSLMVSGVSPFHQVGAGRLTATVIWPGFMGLAIACDPLAPDSSQFPILSAARAPAEVIHRAAAAANQLVNTGRENTLSLLMLCGRPRLRNPVRLQHLRSPWARGPQPAS